VTGVQTCALPISDALVHMNTAWDIGEHAAGADAKEGSHRDEVKPGGNLKLWCSTTPND